VPDLQDQVPVPADTPLILAAARGLCPQCGTKTLFATVTRFSAKCRVCALDFTQFNVGDGPAAFLILIIGGLVTAFAVVTEVKVHPPFWVHIMIWLPLTVALVIVSLRIAKAALLVLEYRNKAREGALVKPATGV
jgi:uncharacterized protein (DUF983 family)